LRDDFGATSIVARLTAHEAAHFHRSLRVFIVGGALVHLVLDADEGMLVSVEGRLCTRVLLVSANHRLQERIDRDGWVMQRVLIRPSTSAYRLTRVLPATASRSKSFVKVIRRCARWSLLLRIVAGIGNVSTYTIFVTHDPIASG